MAGNNWAGLSARQAKEREGGRGELGPRELVGEKSAPCVISCFYTWCDLVLCLFAEVALYAMYLLDYSVALVQCSTILLIRGEHKQSWGGT